MFYLFFLLNIIASINCYCTTSSPKICLNNTVRIVTNDIVDCYPCKNGVCINGLCLLCRCPSGYFWDEANQLCSLCNSDCSDGEIYGQNCLCQKPCKIGEIYSWLNQNCSSCGGSGWCDGNGFCHTCECPISEYYDPLYLACLPCKWQFGNECKYYGLNCECSETSLLPTTSVYQNL